MPGSAISPQPGLEMGRRMEGAIKNTPQGSPQEQLMLNQGKPPLGTDVQKERIGQEAMRGVSGTDPSGRRLSGVIPQNVAGAQEQAAFGQAQQAGSDADTDKRISDFTYETLNKSPQLRQVAEYSRVKGAGWLSGLQELERTGILAGKQFNSERIRALSTVTQSAREFYNTSLSNWEKGVEKAITSDLRHISADPEDQAKVDAQIAAEYVKRHPQPAFDDVLKNVVEENTGLTVQQFQNSFKKALREGGEDSNIADDSPADWAPQVKSTRDDYAKVTDPRIKKLVQKRLADARNAGKLTDEELQYILTGEE